MIKSKCNLLVQHRCCTLAFVISIALGLFSATTADAWVISSFPPSSFFVVDRTTPDCTPPFNPNGEIIGYKVDTVGVDKYHYQLTDTSELMTVIMWNQNPSAYLDFSKEWMMEFKLYFGTGKQNKPWDSVPADGICLVFRSVYYSLNNGVIGVGTQHMGYGQTPYLNSSFAIEWDTEYNDYGPVNPYESAFEGSKRTNINHHCHIGLLKNSSMSDITGSFVPMQDNFESVCTDDWYCCAVYWRINRDSFGVAENYDLLVYMSQGPEGNEMKLRRSLRFDSLSHFVKELSPNYTYTKDINWAFSSATCEEPNRQALEIVRITNDTTIVSTIPGYKATIQWEYETDLPEKLQYGANGSRISTASCGYIRVPDDVSLPSFIRPDKIFCEKEVASISISLDPSIYSGAQWSIESGNPPIYRNIDTGNVLYPIFRYRDSLATDKDSIMIRVIVWNSMLNRHDTIYFNLLFSKSETELKDYLDSVLFSRTPGNRVLPVDKNNLEPSILLPPIDNGCIYSVSSPDSASFRTKPWIYEDSAGNNHLRFALYQNINCETKVVKLMRECANECPEEFLFYVNKIDIKYRKVRSCDGMRIQLQDCNRSDVPLEFLLYKDDELIASDTGIMNIVANDTGRYTGRYVNLVTGDTVDIDDMEIDIDSNDIVSPIVLELLPIEVELITYPNYTFCRYEISYFISGMDTNYSVFPSNQYRYNVPVKTRDSADGKIYTVVYELLCDPADTSTREDIEKYGFGFSLKLDSTCCGHILLPSENLQLKK